LHIPFVIDNQEQYFRGNASNSESKSHVKRNDLKLICTDLVLRFNDLRDLPHLSTGRKYALSGCVHLTPAPCYPASAPAAPVPQRVQL
jgi:hypothetical protein